MPRGQFLSEHEQKNSHLCHIKEINFVPGILSPALPRPDRGDEEHEKWCRSMLLIFKPWRTPEDLRGAHATWRLAFDNHKFSELAKTVMCNMNVEHECQDAKKASDYRKQTGTASASDQFGFDDECSDMNSLGVVLQNDTNLHDEIDDENDFEVQEGLQTTLRVSQVSELDRVIGDAEQNGVFSKNRSQSEIDNIAKGSVSKLQQGDEETINMHSTLMKELKKLKCPASLSNNEEELETSVSRP